MGASHHGLVSPSTVPTREIGVCRRGESNKGGRGDGDGGADKKRILWIDVVVMIGNDEVWLTRHGR